MRCDSMTCWCRAFPPVRLIPSLGVFYTVEELEPESATVRRFEYREVEP